VAGGLATVANDVLQLAAEPLEPERWSPAAVIETALADVQSRKAAWTAADLTRSVSDALPDHLGATTGDQVARLLDTLTAAALERATALNTQRPGDDALPRNLRLGNGESACQAPGARLYATPDHIHTERILVAATAGKAPAACAAAQAQRFIEHLAESGVELGVDQAAAVRGSSPPGRASNRLWDRPAPARPSYLA
jgi:hypothetical protein